MYTLAEIKRIVPGYRGKIENFDITKVKRKISKSSIQCIESRVEYPIFIAEGDELREATLEEAETFKSEQRSGFKNVRSSYRRNTENISPARSDRIKQDPTLTEDCFRCLLVKRGTIFLPDNVICTCAVEIPNTPTIFEEKTAKHQITDWTANSELHMLAMEEVLKQKAQVTNCKLLFESENLKTATHVIGIRSRFYLSVILNPMQQKMELPHLRPSSSVSCPLVISLFVCFSVCSLSALVLFVVIVYYFVYVNVKMI
jgi:hypothetical protein